MVDDRTYYALRNFNLSMFYNAYQITPYCFLRTRYLITFQSWFSAHFQLFIDFQIQRSVYQINRKSLTSLATDASRLSSFLALIRVFCDCLPLPQFCFSLRLLLAWRLRFSQPECLKLR